MYLAVVSPTTDPSLRLSRLSPTFVGPSDAHARVNWRVRRSPWRDSPECSARVKAAAESAYRQKCQTLNELIGRHYRHFSSSIRLNIVETKPSCQGKGHIVMMFLLTLILVNANINRNVDSLYFVFLPAGFQRADHSPCGHHRPHRLLLVGQLHPGGNFNYVGARCLGLPHGGTESRSVRDRKQMSTFGMRRLKAVLAL